MDHLIAVTASLEIVLGVGKKWELQGFVFPGEGFEWVLTWGRAFPPFFGNSPDSHHFLEVSPPQGFPHQSLINILS